MNISCLPVSLFPELIHGSMTIMDWAEKAKEIGLDGIDISIAMLHNHTPVYLSNIQDTVSMPIIMAATYPDFTHPDSIQRRRELDYLRADIALCSQLGIRYLRILAGQAHPETTRTKGVRWALENIIEADNIARAYNVRLLYENHSKPSAWKYTDFSYPIDIFLEIFEGLADTGIRLNFDLGNITSLGLDPLKVLPLVLDRIETIHVSDMQKSGEFAPVAIGTGVVPIGAVLSVLKTSGFAGWLCIEEASNQGLPGIARAAEYVRETWENA
jgi:sugar phosphate isomerase/epimerase